MRTVSISAGAIFSQPQITMSSLRRRYFRRRGLSCRLCGGDIFAAADYHVVFAAGEEHVTIPVDPAEISSRAPSISQRGVIFAPGVAFHDARRADDDLSDLTRRQKIIAFVAHPNFDIRQRLADRIKPPKLQLHLRGRALDAMVIGTEHRQRRRCLEMPQSRAGLPRSASAHRRRQDWSTMKSRS